MKVNPIAEDCPAVSPYLHMEQTARPAILYHYVADVDATYQQALKACAELVFAPMNTFYGDRFACVKDFAGNNWAIAARVENITLKEVQKRVSSFGSQSASAAPKG